MYWFHIDGPSVSVDHVRRETTTEKDIHQGNHVPMWTGHKKAWAEKLPGLPCSVYEELAKIPPDDLGATEKRQLQELRRHILEKGEAPEKAVRAVWGGELANAPSRLRQAIVRGMAMPEVPSGTTQRTIQSDAWRGVIDRSERIQCVEELPDGGAIYRRTL
jgi:hypothetical protein